MTESAENSLVKILCNYFTTVRIYSVQTIFPHRIIFHGQRSKSLYRPHLIVDEFSPVSLGELGGRTDTNSMFVLVVSVPAKNRSITVLFLLNPKDTNAIFYKSYALQKQSLNLLSIRLNIFRESSQLGKHSFDSLHNLTSLSLQ